MTNDLRKAAQDALDGWDDKAVLSITYEMEVLRTALAAPAQAAPDDVCEWGKDKDGDYVATCHKVIWTVEDEDDEPQGWLTYCYGCGKRIRFIEGNNNGTF